MHCLLRTALRCSIGLLLAGCLADTTDFAEPRVDERVVAVTGGHLHPADDDSPLPPGVLLDDGLDDEEAIAIALWNNPDFAVALADLGVRRAQLAEAGLLSNPSLWTLLPWGPKLPEFILYAPLTSLLQRAGTIANARSNARLAVAQVALAAVAVLRTVRLALAEHRLAQRREQLARALEAIAAELANLDAARLRSGDISELDAQRSAITAIDARRECDERCAVVQTTRTQLLGVLALPAGLPIAEVATPVQESFEPGPEEALIQLALATRPDLRAAEADVESAGDRAGLARGEWRQLILLVSAKTQNDEFLVGPGLQVNLPIFQFGTRVATAEAELLQSLRRCVAAQNRIRLEVTTARQQWLIAVRRRTRAADEILPARREVLRGAQRTVAVGQDSPLVVLQARQALVLAEIDLAEADAALARARAELERAVGCRLPLPMTLPTAEPR